MTQEYMKTFITLLITMALVFFVEIFSKIPPEYQDEFNDALKTKNQEEILNA